MPMTPISTPLTGPASILKPLVYKSGKTYSCELLNVIGKGNTPEAAVEDWNASLKEHLATADEDDEIVKMVKGIVTPKTEPLKDADLYAKYGLRPVDKSKRRI
jgi:predicted RNase H-like HicB family nuclease